MSPIKFEENLKEKLEKRTIQSSKDAWDKLSNRLQPESKKAGIHKFWWLSIAASLLLVLWVSKSFFSTNEVLKSTIVVEPEVENTPLEQLQKDLKQEEIIAVEPTLKPKLIKEKDLVESIENQKNDIEELPVFKSLEESVIVQESLSDKKELDLLSFEDQKVQEVVAQIVAIKEKNKNVSDSEIDALLNQAQREIEVKKLLIENSTIRTARTINADELLYEVEKEINKSFRDKVFKELKIQYKSVKNAVAQRNNY